MLKKLIGVALVSMVFGFVGGMLVNWKRHLAITVLQVQTLDLQLRIDSLEHWKNETDAGISDMALRHDGFDRQHSDSIRTLWAHVRDLEKK